MFTTGDTHHERLRDEDDELLQFAIQQSLVQSGSEEEQVCVSVVDVCMNVVDEMC